MCVQGLIVANSMTETLPDASQVVQAL